ncbi:MAG: hypothetical protein M3198_08755 [Actinomycetota bacterium]|nr:hypothetical protein [Actinomycetota bacterium]
MATTVLIASLGIPAQASSEWTPPETVLSEDQHINSIDIGAGPRGYAVITWESGSSDATPDQATGHKSGQRVWVSVRRPGEMSFGEPQALSGPGGRSPRVAVAPNGQTVVTWLRPSGAIKAAFRDVAGNWSRIQLVARGARTPAAISIATDGTALATWRSGRRGRTVAAAVRPPDGVFTDRVILAKDDGMGVFGPVPAINRRGTGIVTWTGQCPLYAPDERKRARVVRLHHDAETDLVVVRRVREIQNSKCPTSHVGAAMADDGHAAVVISGHLRDWDGIRVAVRNPGDSFETARLISRRGRPANFAAVGAASDGTILVGWSLYSDEGRSRGIEASVRPSGGEFSFPQRVSRTRGGLEDLAVGPRGHAVLVRHALRSGRIKAAFMKPDQRFGEAETVSGIIGSDALALSVVAINRRGNAVAAWGKPDPQANAKGVFASRRHLGAK